MLSATLQRPETTVVLQSLSTLEDRVRTAAANALQDGLWVIVGLAQYDFLSGPRPCFLDSITTRLRNSIGISVDYTGDGVRATIGSDVPYAAYHEFGFSGIERVRAHTRTVAVFDAEGSPIEPRQPVFDHLGRRIAWTTTLGEAARRIKGATVLVQNVRAHDRHVNYGGRHPLDSAIDKGQEQLTERIATALNNLNP